MKRDYRPFAEQYMAGDSVSEIARREGINCGSMYRGIKGLGTEMRSRSESRRGKGKGKTGALSPSFKGGVRIDKDGYRRILTGSRYELEHRMIAERAIGRRLSVGEVVHHINGIRLDNRPENLLVCTAAYHQLIHDRMDALAACGDPNFKKFRYCKQWDAPMNMSHSKRGASYHKPCAAKRQKARNEAKKLAYAAELLKAA